MYYCPECRSMFTEPATFIEKHPYGHTYVEETWGCCPYCNNTDFVISLQCSKCGEAIIDEYVEIDNRSYCNECYVIRNIDEEVR